MDDLFEAVRVRLGCIHISDIPFIQDKERIRRVIADIPRAAYPEKQWIDFESYAFRDKTPS